MTHPNSKSADGKLALLSDRSIGERRRWGCLSVGGVWRDFGRAVIDLCQSKRCSAGIDFCAAMFARGCLHSTTRWSECPCQTMRKAGFIDNHAGSCEGVQKQQASSDDSSHPLCTFLHFNSSQPSLV